MHPENCIPVACINCCLVIKYEQNVMANLDIILIVCEFSKSLDYQYSFVHYEATFLQSIFKPRLKHFVLQLYLTFNGCQIIDFFWEHVLTIQAYLVAAQRCCYPISYYLSPVIFRLRMVCWLIKVSMHTICWISLSCQCDWVTQ